MINKQADDCPVAATSQTALDYTSNVTASPSVFIGKYSFLYLKKNTRLTFTQGDVVYGVLQLITSNQSGSKHVCANLICNCPLFNIDGKLCQWYIYDIHNH